jgi:hypothetical protein
MSDSPALHSRLLLLLNIEMSMSKWTQIQITAATWPCVVQIFYEILLSTELYWLPGMHYLRKNFTLKSSALQQKWPLVGPLSKICTTPLLLVWGSSYISECIFSLKDMKNFKSSGIDGFTGEFYKLFWKDIKILKWKSWKWQILC